MGKKETWNEPKRPKTTQNEQKGDLKQTKTSQKET